MGYTVYIYIITIITTIVKLICAQQEKRSGRTMAETCQTFPTAWRAGAWKRRPFPPEHNSWSAWRRVKSSMCWWLEVVAQALGWRPWGDLGKTNKISDEESQIFFWVEVVRTWNDMNQGMRGLSRAGRIPMRREDVHVMIWTRGRFLVLLFNSKGFLRLLYTEWTACNHSSA